MREIRKLMIINILATDMKFHFDKLDKWEKLMVKYGQNLLADFGFYFFIVNKYRGGVD